MGSYEASMMSEAELIEMRGRLRALLEAVEDLECRAWRPGDEHHRLASQLLERVTEDHERLAQIARLTYA
jgi:hypothetical protein